MTDSDGHDRRQSSIFLPSLLSFSIGAIIVLSTSPTTSSLLNQSRTSLLNQPLLTTILTLHAIITDLTFISLIAFLILCNHEPSAKWIARNQSFPYSYTPSWILGPQALNFQTLIFEIFHVGWISRTVHMLNMVLEEGLWAMVVYLTFGAWGLLVLCTGLTVQAFSYKDVYVGVGIVASNALLMGGCWWSLQFCLVQTCGLSLVDTLSAVKGLLFWTVTVRTLSHILEPLPPTYRPDVECFDDNFGSPGWKLCLSNLPNALWLVVLGNVSEFGAGMPGRLYNVVVYKCMYKVGFRSRSDLLDVGDVKVQAWKVIEHGWMAHPQTAKMYQWASSGGVGLLEKDVISEKLGSIVL